MDCRMCGACCVAISISSVIPVTGKSKAAGERCVHLKNDNRCELFGKAERPAVCSEYQPDVLFCGNSRDEAISILTSIESGF